jgi:hypothetical protein
MLVKTYEDWKKSGRGVKKGSVPIKTESGEVMWDEKDTYSLHKYFKKTLGLGRIRRRKKSYDYDDSYGSINEDYYFAKEGTFW